MKKFVLLLGIICLIGIGSISAQIAKYQSMFIYNFAQNIEWPKAYQAGDFKIGVLGNSVVLPELENIAKTYKVGNQSIKVIKYKTADQIANCHILFVPKQKSAEIGKVLSKISKYNTLLITEKEGFANAGSAINFVIKSGQLKFELNNNNASKKGLSVSAYLKKLAI